MHDNLVLVHARPDHGGYYAVKLLGLGLFITAGLDDDGQPYVSVNTEDMAPEHTYDETTGLRGTARPYAVVADPNGGAWADVEGPDDKGKRRMVARHYPIAGSPNARHAAQDHALMLNNAWPTVCGMPMISVHLGDAELYDARDHGAPREGVIVSDADPCPGGMCNVGDRCTCKP